MAPTTTSTAPTQLPRLVASDLDGTLLSPAKRIEPRTVAALRALADRGTIVVAATGRSVGSALKMVRPAEVISWAICSNGAAVYDLVNDRLVRHTAIESHIVADMLAAVRGEHPEIGVAWETLDGFFWDDHYVAHRMPRLEPGQFQWGAHANTLPTELQSPASTSTLKVLITHPELGFGAWSQELNRLLPDSVLPSNSGTDFVEVTAAGVHKGAVLAELAAELDVESDDVVAFGDQDNDLTMLRWAGRGFAMEDAHPDVLAITPLRAPAHTDDGVAQVIEAWLRAEGSTED